MNKLLLTFLFLLSLMSLPAQEYKLLLTGASFASDHNGWFEIGCRHLNALPVNKAVAAHSIANTANMMHEGTLYTKEEFREINALVIMHVHNRDVFEESQLLDDYTAYPTPFTRDNYAICYDYVIKKYIADCYVAGKPAIIVLCTDWHDGRVTFNSSIRKLASKWGLPLVEFDKHIGFSKNATHPATGKQTSLIYAQDTQTIDGVKYGWHPRRGQHEYIQQRMAAIFVEQMKKVLPIK
ncbi:DUF5040 domain-containing protein [Bacteroides sp. 51]|uniref:DUF5040 domain-containing protein n=1 Tax=Bacteroides sp. 51 TaxID=2302938 RepID=UPI0013D6C779|nr:DUF5040 domain-containing protein [Bacteroides sp. 51]NDV84591.1 DUF5040 domain-containing protein [Bacteroides sp. 51]